MPRSVEVDRWSLEDTYLRSVRLLKRTINYRYNVCGYELSFLLHTKIGLGVYFRLKIRNLSKMHSFEMYGFTSILLTVFLYRWLIYNKEQNANTKYKIYVLNNIILFSLQQKQCLK